MIINPPPINSGWGEDIKQGPASVWVFWFQNIWNFLKDSFVGYDSYVSTTNITHGGTLTTSVSSTKVGRVVSLIITYSDTVSTSSTVGTTTFSLPYTPVSVSVANAINVTTLASLGNGIISTDGNLYPPTATSGAGESIVISATYFTSA